MGLLLCLILVRDAVGQSVIEGVMRYCDSCVMLVLGFYVPELFSLGERGKGLNYVMSVGVLGSALSGKIFSQLPLGYLEIFLMAAVVGLALLPETVQKREV
jgi:MFS family permease